MRLSARPRFLAVADTEHGTELGSAPNDQTTVAQAWLTKVLSRRPLQPQDSSEASAPERDSAEGLRYEAHGASSRSRPRFRAGAQGTRAYVDRVHSRLPRHDPIIMSSSYM